MNRSPNIALTQRINHAYTLLKKDMPSAEVLDTLIKQYGVSKVQAYRYIQAAKKNQGLVSVPEKFAVFTVKLPSSLIRRIKAAATSMGLSIGKVVKMALEEFLSKQDHGGKKEAS